MKKLTTNLIARIVKCHPNTVRLYEKWRYLPPIPRAKNGYRLFSEEHLKQMKLARIALPGPYPGGGLSVKMLVKASAVENYKKALFFAGQYRENVKQETKKAKAVLNDLSKWFGSEKKLSVRPLVYSRREAARVLGLTIDSLRTWERNNLVPINKNISGYCKYSERDLSRLKIISALRTAGYSLAAIHQMFLKYDKGGISTISKQTLAKILNTPSRDAPIVYVTDMWLTTLAKHEKRAKKITNILISLRQSTRKKQHRY